MNKATPEELDRLAHVAMWGVSVNGQVQSAEFHKEFAERVVKKGNDSGRGFKYEIVPLYTRSALDQALALSREGWIPVTERLPEIDGFLAHAKQVLVACADGTVFAGEYHTNGCFYPDQKFPYARMANTTGCSDGVYSGCSHIAKATHWMPLPKPPSVHSTGVPSEQIHFPK